MRLQSIILALCFLLIQNVQGTSINKLSDKTQYNIHGTVIPTTYLNKKGFDNTKDLLLVQFDCKTDIDDIHSGAALATLMRHPDYSEVNYHVVAGAYGIQEGLYVPPNQLFEKAFGAKWSDAHNEMDKALNEVLKKVIGALDNGGSIWVADGGQSDFTAKWVVALQKMRPGLQTKERIHVVQHSDWNEEVTTPTLLTFVKEQTTYHKIPDGNATDNGTPGFRSDAKINYKGYLSKSPDLIALWDMAIKIGNTYNGKEGRYLNTSVAAGGLDFSDLAETCFILGISDLKDGNAFFEMIAQ